METAQKKGGLYLLKSGLQSVFKAAAFTCKCGCGLNNVVQDLVDKLHELRNAAKSKFRVSNAVRCEKHNKEVGGSDISAHLATKEKPCKAADIQDVEIDISDFFRAAVPLGFGGVGLYVGDYGPYMHVDVKYERPKQFRYWYYKSGYHYFENPEECLAAYIKAFELDKKERE